MFNRSSVSREDKIGYRNAQNLFIYITAILNLDIKKLYLVKGSHKFDGKRF